MNEFMDFWLVLAKPSYYNHLRGYAGVGLPNCPAGGFHFWGLRKAFRALLCNDIRAMTFR